jgi:hypothetical protein
MTWAYLFQGTRIDENIKIYWFVHIIKLCISDLYVFVFESFLKFSFAHLLIFLNLCIFWIASFCWGILCYLLITALHQLFLKSIISWWFYWISFCFILLLMEIDQVLSISSMGTVWQKMFYTNTNIFHLVEN